MKMILFELILLINLLPWISSLNIFLISPGMSNSHVLFNYRIAKMLVDRGHNVTVFVHQMSSAPILDGPENVEVIKFSPAGTEEVRERSMRMWSGFAFYEPTLSDYSNMSHSFREMLYKTCREMLNDHELIDYLKSKQFDITLSHFFFSCPPGFSHRIGVEKFVWIASGAFVFEIAAWRIGLPFIHSYMPNHMMKKASTDKMTFLDRVKNTFWAMLMLYATVEETCDIAYDSSNSLFYQPPYNTKSDPDLETVIKKTKTILINGVPFLDFPKPLLPGMLHLGDLERKEVKKLPQDWQKIMDESNKGVVLFSFGTVANTTDMPLPLKEAFFKAFTKFVDYTILWRLEGELPSNLSKYPHIQLVKWVPQCDLLHHKKMKLFITHGGYNSLLESSQAGVPMLFVPLLIDQFANAERARNLGIGLVLDKHSAKAELIEQDMIAILNDDRYATNARHLASILKDNIIDNEIAAAHQIEKIAKSGRLWPTMRAAQRLNWIQYFCVDVGIVLTVMICVSSYAVIAMCCLIWRIMQAPKRKK